MMESQLNNGDFDNAVRALDEGQVILYPTDTIWGLGGNPFDQAVFERINEIKQRPTDKPFLLLVSNLEQLRYYVADLHPRIETLISFYTRPMTVIYPNARNLPDHCLGSNGTIALRVTSDSFCKALIERTGYPLISTSANVSDEPPPSRFGSISSIIFHKVDYVVKHRQHDMTQSVPSQIFDFDEEGNLKMVRP
mgnify:CR=1 FL=1